VGKKDQYYYWRLSGEQWPWSTKAAFSFHLLVTSVNTLGFEEVVRRLMACLSPSSQRVTVDDSISAFVIKFIHREVHMFIVPASLAKCMRWTANSREFKRISELRQIQANWVKAHTKMLRRKKKVQAHNDKPSLAIGEFEGVIK
jgi:hypothetical protein